MTEGHLSRGSILRTWSERRFTIKPPTDTSNSRGPGQLLIALYGLFALAASARAAYQIATRWQQAPIAYGLSAVAAAVYLLALWGLARQTPGAWRLAVATCAFETAGVLLVGALTTLRPDLLGAATVWSGFGAGYGYVPLILPALGLAWLLRAETRALYGVGR